MNQHQALNKLPNAERKLAFRNARKHYTNFEWQFNNGNYSNIGDALQTAFVWSDTPEGYNYWYSLAKKHGNRQRVHTLTTSFTTTIPAVR